MKNWTVSQSARVFCGRNWIILWRISGVKNNGEFNNWSFLETTLSIDLKNIGYVFELWCSKTFTIIIMFLQNTFGIYKCVNTQIWHRSRVIGSTTSHRTIVRTGFLYGYYNLGWLYCSSRLVLKCGKWAVLELGPMENFIFTEMC